MPASLPILPILLGVPFGVEWVKRKVDARVERRVGPPLLQPVYDFVKLWQKKTVLPEDAGFFFRAGPPILFLLAVAALYVAWSRPAWAVLILLVLFSLMTLAKMAIADSVKSPFTALGMGRLGSMKLALDPAFPLAFLAPAFAWGFSMDWPAKAWLLFPVALAASLAELELPPFDISHAKSEIVAGWKTELSGRLLALADYAEYAKMAAVALMLAAMFGPAWSWLKALGVFTAMVAVSIAMPRMRFVSAVRALSLINIITMAEVILCLSLA